MAERTFVILHGWQGSGPDHWQSWLAGRLRARGEAVRYPVLPDPDEPRLDPWLAALDGELVAATGETTVLCHSLACVLWLHHAARRPERRVERVLLVAPPSPRLDERALAPFFPLPQDVDHAAAAASTRLVCADDDPYCPERADRAYPGLETDVVAGGGHLNADAGRGPWPALEAWCLDGRAKPS